MFHQSIGAPNNSNNRPYNKLPTFQICNRLQRDGYCGKCPNECPFSHIEPTSVPWTQLKPIKGAETPRYQGKLCRYFSENQHCSLGPACTFIHVFNKTNVPNKAFRVCNEFRTSGICTQCPGNCRFDHIVPTAVVWSQPNQQLPQKPVGILCSEYQATQQCVYGTQCKQVHLLPANKVPNPVPVISNPTPPSKPSVQACFDFHHNGYCTKCPSKCKRIHVLETAVSWTKRGADVPNVITDRVCQSFETHQTCLMDKECDSLHILNVHSVPTSEIGRAHV